MFTQVFLNQIQDAIFKPFFMVGILEIHADKVSEGEYRTDIRDYNTAMETLVPLLNAEEKSLLTEYESICKTIRECYARHGFIAGIYAGFRHAFTPAKEIDAGYDKYVMDEVMKQPNMQRYHELYKAVTHKNKLYEMLAEGRAENCDSPMVCISCYWSEMACSAGSIGFYCGYRAAGSITDRFGLMETDYMGRMSKLLTLEHAFRYIETVAERERRMERQQNNTWDADNNISKQTKET